MTQYKKEFPFSILFPPEVPKNVLAEWLSVKGVPQYHVAGRESFFRTRLRVNQSRVCSLEVRALHRHCKGVGSIPAGGPVVDEFFSTFLGWIFDMCMIST